jgi:Flp pilus assembly pilin Flp
MVARRLYVLGLRFSTRGPSTARISVRTFCMHKTLRTLISDESGAQLVEYGLLALLVAVVVMVSVKSFGANVNTLYANAAGSI